MANWCSAASTSICCGNKPSAKHKKSEEVLPVISGRRTFLEIIKQEGVEVVFGNPGTTELALMDAFAVENDIRYVLGLQEAVVMAMADGYAQASGKLAVVNLHVTPGLGNAMGMLYDAQKAASPILVTAGQHDQDFNRTEPIDRKSTRLNSSHTVISYAVL